MNFGNHIAMSSFDVSKQSFPGLTPQAKGKKWSKPLSVDLDQPQPLISYDKFLIVQGTGGAPLSRQSPFVIQKYFGDTESIKRLRSGDYLIETKSEKQSQNYLQMKKMGDCDIKVKPHTALNQVKGVIQSDSLKYGVTKEQLIQELKGIGVVDCYFHQKKQEDGSFANNGRVTLTFKGQQRPMRLSICGWLHCKVFDYIPSPMRCFQCHRFGHTSKNCKNTKRCGNCGDDDHGDCDRPSHCVNCDGDHAAYDRDCPQWKMEKEIQTIKAKNNISYSEAKKQVAFTKVTQEKSYAVAAKPSPEANNAIQTLTNTMQAVVNQVKQLSNKIDLLSQRIDAVEKQTKREIPKKRKPEVDTDENPVNAIRSKRISIDTRDDTLEEVMLSSEYAEEYVMAVEEMEKVNNIPPKTASQESDKDKTSINTKPPGPPKPGLSGTGKDTPLPPRGRGYQPWNQSKTGITKPKNGQKGDRPKGVTSRKK